MTGAGERAMQLRATMQAIAPEADLDALAATAARDLRSTQDWARGLRWRAWERAVAGHPYEALRNLRYAVMAAPRLLLSPRTWLVPLRALVGLFGL